MPLHQPGLPLLDLHPESVCKGNTLSVTFVGLDYKSLWWTLPPCQLKQSLSCAWVRKGERTKSSTRDPLPQWSRQESFDSFFVSACPAYFCFKTSLSPPQLWPLFSDIEKLPSSSFAYIKWGAAQWLVWGGPPQVKVGWASPARFKTGLKRSVGLAAATGRVLSWWGGQADGNNSVVFEGCFHPTSWSVKETGQTTSRDSRGPLTASGACSAKQFNLGHAAAQYVVLSKTLVFQECFSFQSDNVLGTWAGPVLLSVITTSGERACSWQGLQVRSWLKLFHCSRQGMLRGSPLALSSLSGDPHVDFGSGLSLRLHMGWGGVGQGSDAGSSPLAVLPRGCFEMCPGAYFQHLLALGSGRYISLKPNSVLS